MSQHYGEALAKDKLKLLAELIERAQIGQNELNEARKAAGKSKLDNKWTRGVNIVKTAPDYSPLLPKFLDKINDGKNVSHQEIYAAFEYIRKADDGLLAKLKITKGEEIHHAIGYAEFARSVEQLSVDDQVKAFTYLSANDFPLGTTPSNTKYGALGKIAHRNPNAVGNPAYLSAHFKNNGVPLQMDTVPNNFDEWVNVWENKIVPQAYTGAAVGRLVDGERVNKIFEAMETDPEGLAKIAQKHGTTPDQIVSAVFSREAIEDIGDSPTLKASREYAKKIGLDNTMSNFRQGKANEGLILDQLGEAGFNPEVVQRQLQTPESIDRSILRVDPREALENTTKILMSGGGVHTNSVARLQRKLEKEFAAAAGKEFRMDIPGAAEMGKAFKNNPFEALKGAALALDPEAVKSLFQGNPLEAANQAALGAGINAGVAEMLKVSPVQQARLASYASKIPGVASQLPKTLSFIGGAARFAGSVGGAVAGYQLADAILKGSTGAGFVDTIKQVQDKETTAEINEAAVKSAAKSKQLAAERELPKPIMDSDTIEKFATDPLNELEYGWKKLTGQV